MSLNKKELNFYKKNGYLVKEKLISNKEINKINSLIEKIINKEEKKKLKLKIQAGLIIITSFITQIHQIKGKF